MAILPHAEILMLHGAAIAAGLAESRATLLVGIDAQLLAGLPLAGTHGDQILRDLHVLNEAGRLTDDSVPLAIWLANFAARAPAHGQLPLIKAALERCAATPPSTAVRSAIPAPRSSSNEAARGGAARIPQPPRCFGRDAMIGELVDALLLSEPPPIPILGPPGIGKSTLCLAAAHHPKVVERYQSRRYFIHCEAHPSPATLASSIGTHLNVSVGQAVAQDLAPPLDLLSEPTLLILDNAEVPWEAHQGEMEGLLTELCAVPGLVVVCTIRGRERPLGPAWRESIYVGPLLDRHAVELFVAVAGARFRGDPLVERIVIELGALPLSVKHFAHNVQVEPSLQDFYFRWKKRRTTIFYRKGGQDRDNFATSMELSLNSPRMTPDGRRLLSILAFLPDGVDHDDLADLPAGDAISTLRQVGVVLDESHRTRMLMSLKEYIQDNYPPSDADIDSVIACYLRIGESLAQRCRETESAQARRRVSAEAANLLTLAERALQQTPPLTGIETALSFVQVLQNARVHVAELLEQIRSRVDQTTDMRTQARCRLCLADDALRRHLLPDATALYQEAGRVFSAAGDRKGEAASIRGMGEVAWRWRAYLDAESLYSRSLILAREGHDLAGTASSLLRLGDVCAHVARHEESAAFYEEALSLYRAAGDFVGQAYCRLGLGELAIARGSFASAETLLLKAASFFQQLENPIGQAACLRARSEAAHRRSDHALFFRLSLESIGLYARHVDAVDTQGWKLA